MIYSLQAIVQMLYKGQSNRNNQIFLNFVIASVGFC